MFYQYKWYKYVLNLLTFFLFNWYIYKFLLIFLIMTLVVYFFFLNVEKKFFFLFFKKISIYGNDN